MSADSLPGAVEWSRLSRWPNPVPGENGMGRADTVTTFGRSDASRCTSTSRRWANRAVDNSVYVSRPIRGTSSGGLLNEFIGQNRWEIVEHGCFAK